MTSADYRAKARQDLAGKWGTALLAALVAGLLGGLVTGSLGINLEVDAEMVQRMPSLLRGYLLALGSVASILGMAQFILGGTIKLGYCRFLLKNHDGEEGQVNDLVSQFPRFTEGFLLELLTGLFVALWSLLLVIPGIIAALKYSMAPFIMLENPGMKPSAALNASKALMEGHKWDLFVLGLSFIGWALLSALTMGIGALWLNPYMNAAYAAFYRNISAQPRIESAPYNF